MSNPSYLCFLSPPDDVSDITTTTSRLIKLSTTTEDDTLDVPGSNEAPADDLSSLVVDQRLTSDSTAVGVFTCTSTTPDQRMTSVSITILLNDSKITWLTWLRIEYIVEDHCSLLGNHD